MASTPEILHVGIDLGTSRSAISASNGEKFVVDSFVGWPVDMVAKKVLKRDVLIGHDAVEETHGARDGEIRGAVAVRGGGGGEGG